MPRAASICLREGCTSKTVKDGRCNAHQVYRKAWDRVSARNRNRPGDWNSRRAKVLARDKFRCQMCDGRPKKPEVDHIIPVSRGGSWDMDNLWTLCQGCHKKKTTKERSQ